MQDDWCGGLRAEYPASRGKRVWGQSSGVARVPFPGTKKYSFASANKNYRA